MSPLYFLAIPFVVFVIGSSLMYLGSRYRDGGASFRDERDTPGNLRSVAPMLENQRQTSWPASSGNNRRR